MFLFPPIFFSLFLFSSLLVLAPVVVYAKLVAAKLRVVFIVIFMCFSCHHLAIQLHFCFNLMARELACFLLNKKKRQKEKKLNLFTSFDSGLGLSFAVPPQ